MNQPATRGDIIIGVFVLCVVIIVVQSITFIGIINLLPTGGK